MFDPPYRTPIAIVGRPISMIPDVEEKYRNFLDWCFKVGRLRPDDPQDWATISAQGHEAARGSDFSGRMERSDGVGAEPNQVLGRPFADGLFLRLRLSTEWIVLDEIRRGFEDAWATEETELDGDTKRDDA
jgi:hypothetical protein